MSSEKILCEQEIHSFLLGNGNLTRCERLYRTIGFNSDKKEDVIQIREVTTSRKDVTCKDCVQILNGSHNVFKSIQDKLRYK